jgi:hypothetical protein
LSDLWLPGPGMPAGSTEEFVGRVHRQIENYAVHADVARAYVVVELADGARFPLDAISAEPGNGFVTLTPHPGAEDDFPGQVMVPVGSIRRIELAGAEAERSTLGFSLPTPWQSM